MKIVYKISVFIAVISSSAVAQPLLDAYGTINDIAPATTTGVQEITKMCIATSENGNPYTATDNIYLAGYFKGTNVDFDLSTASSTNITSNNSGVNSDGFIAKYSEDGTFVEVIQIEPSAGTNNVVISDMVLDASENVYVIGHFSGTGTVDFDPGAGTSTLVTAGQNDVFVAKYNSDLDYQWAFRFGASGAGAGGENNDYGYGIALDATNDVYITGGLGMQSAGSIDFDPSTNANTTANTSGSDIFVAKYTNAGAYSWHKTIGNAIGYYGNTNGYDIAVDGSDVYVVGRYKSGTASMDFNWDGGTTNLISHPVDDMDGFVLNCSTAGTFDWAFNIGGTKTSASDPQSSDEVLCLAIDHSSNIYVGGYFSRATTASAGMGVDFDPSTGGTASKTPDNAGDAFVASYTSAGAYRWVAHFAPNDATNGNDANMDFVKDLKLDMADRLYVLGQYSCDASTRYVDFDPGTGTANKQPYLTSSGSNRGHAFVVQLSSDAGYGWFFQLGATASGKQGDVYANSIAFSHLNDGGAMVHEDDATLRSWTNSSLYVAGKWSQYIVFQDPAQGGSVEKQAYADGTDAFITKFGSSGGGGDVSYDYSAMMGVAGEMSLPVKMLSFSATPENKKVRLNWITASEQSNAYFMVQRSIDGENFADIEKVKGAGDSNEKLNYETYDEHPFAGVSYYRLKQVDFNGAESYSAAKPVQFLAGYTDRLFPNPASANDRTYLSFNAPEEENILIVVYDITGKESYSNVTISSGTEGQLIAIDPEGRLTPGVYYVVASSDDRVFRQKLVIK